MESYTTEDHYKLLLSKEWLVRIHNDLEKSVPYLMKFYSSPVDLSCCILVTDTKQVWGEVLSSKHLARRWRDCNTANSSSWSREEDEDEWRTATLELISAAHSLGGIMDLSFEIVESHYSDFAFELGSDSWKWRWETFSVGPKVSAEILSKHLIMPLISVTHLAFSSADPVSELSDADLENAVDKIGRSARRTVDTHVKHAISRPRAATTMRRMTSMFNFLPDLPAIVSEALTPDLSIRTMQVKSRASPSPRPPVSAPPASPTPVVRYDSTGALESATSQVPQPTPAIRGSATQAPADDSETESDDEGQSASAAIAKNSPPVFISKPSSSQPGPSRQQTPPPQAARSSQSMAQSSADESSPPRPAPPTKKVRRVASSSSDEDSETERKKTRTGIIRGAKQPIKRGGRRF